MKKDTLIVVAILILVGAGAFIWVQSNSEVTPEAADTDDNKTDTTEIISTYDECVDAGYQVNYSEPPTCVTSDGISFTRDVDSIADEITSYEECVAAGYPIMESYPEQCAIPGGRTFTRELNPTEREDADIDIDYPL